MSLGLLQGHSLISPFQEIVDKTPQIRTILIPFFFVVNYQTCPYIFNSVRMILRLKRCIVCYDFEYCNAQSPKINSFIIATSYKNLRGHVKMSSDNGEHISSLSSEESFLGYTKINDFHLFFDSVIKYIFRFDITMTNISAVEIV